GARYARHARELRADVLHDHLALPDEIVDVDGDTMGTAAHQKHEVVVLDVGGGAAAEELAQVVQRVLSALELDAARLVLRDEPVGLRRQPLLDGGGRYGERQGAGAHHPRLGNGEGQRQIDREGRAAAARARDLEAPAERLDLGAHDIHADAAAGEL